MRFFDLEKGLRIGVLFLALSVSGSKAFGSESGDASERIFENGLRQLEDIYGTAGARLPSTGYRDVRMACIGDVFLEWQAAFLALMSRTSLALNNMTLADYGKFMAEVDQNQRAMNSIRKGMVDRIHEEIAHRRANHQWPAGPLGLTFTSSEIHQAELVLNFRDCVDDVFDRAIDEMAPPADLSQMDTVTFKVTWRQSAAGGVEPVWEKVSDTGGLTPLMELILNIAGN